MSKILKTNSKHYAFIDEIAKKMKKNCEENFVDEVVKAAKEYEGMFDLMILWNEAEEAGYVSEEEEIVIDLQKCLCDIKRFNS